MQGKTLINPNRYESKFAKKVIIEVEVMLDMVPGAWHEPEDIMKWMCTHSYVQSVTLKGDKE